MADITKKIKNLVINYKQAPAMVWRRCNAHLSYRFSNFKRHKAAPPEAINFYPTDRCNLKCSMCFERLRKPRHEMQLSDWQMIIDQVKKFRPRIHISGGEPFLYPYIMNLITFIKRENLFLAVTTNGTFLSEYANDIVISGVNRLHISIDGPEKIHDRIRRVPGTFNRIMNGLKKIKVLRKASRLPVIRINSMLNLDDPAAMQEVINIACYIDAESVQFQHPLFVDKQSLTSHRFFLKKNLKLDLNYWENANIDIEKPKDFAAASEIIRHLQAERSIKVNVFPDMSEKNLELYYTNANNFHRTYQGACHAMWNTATILPSGDLESCPDYIVGNCKKSPFISIWNSSIMKQLRKRIRQDNLFTVCHGCCFFYS